MRCTKIPLSLSSLVVLCLAVCTLPGSNAQCYTEVGCQSPSVRSVPDSNLFTKRQPFVPKSKASTNAERLSNGLPLLPPTRRSNQLLPRAPRASPAPMVTYRGYIQVLTNDPANTVLGFVTSDLDYRTPFLSNNKTAALQTEFSLPVSATSGNQLQLQQFNDPRGPMLGLVVGRDSSNSDIAPGSFNYLYFGPVNSPGTPTGSTPLNVDNFFSTSTGLQKAAETSLWSVDLTTGSMTVQWINTDGSSPTTRVFVQSNHLYGGGDPTAFQSRFPAPVTDVWMKFAPISQS